MKAKWIVTAGLALSGVLLVGCETTTPPGVERGPDGTVAYNVLIEASEPGARIEVNREFMGNTPLNVKVYGDKDGTFHNFGSYEFIFQAFPLVTNQFVQTRVYRTGGILMPEDHIPQRIYFDMNQNTPAYPAYPPPDYYGAPYYGPPAYYGPSFDFFFGGHGYHRYGGHYGGHHSHGLHGHRR
jgi:hypothetical protein